MCACVLVDGDTLCAHVCVHYESTLTTGGDVPNVWKRGSVPKISNSREACGKGRAGRPQGTQRRRI